MVWLFKSLKAINNLLANDAFGGVMFVIYGIVAVLYVLSGILF